MNEYIVDRPEETVEGVTAGVYGPKKNKSQEFNNTNNSPILETTFNKYVLNDRTRLLIRNYLGKNPDTLSLHSLKSLCGIEDFALLEDLSLLNKMKKRKQQLTEEEYERKHDIMKKQTGKDPSKPVDEIIKVELKTNKSKFCVPLPIAEFIHCVPATDTRQQHVGCKRINKITAPIIIALSHAQKVNPMYVYGKEEEKAVLWLAIQRQNMSDELEHAALQKQGKIDSEEKFEKIEVGGIYPIPEKQYKQWLKEFEEHQKKLKNTTPVITTGNPPSKEEVTPSDEADENIHDNNHDAPIKTPSRPGMS